MRAISAFSLLAGMSTRRCFAVTALRMRESMSEIGSVIFVVSLLKPKSQIPNPKSQQLAKSLGFGFWDLGCGIYQLLFVTPVMSPSNASFRKQRRHIANFRM